MRGGYTEEQGRLLGNGRCPESGDKKTTAIPKVSDHGVNSFKINGLIS